MPALFDFLKKWVLLLPIGVFANTFTLSGEVSTPSNWLGGNGWKTWFGVKPTWGNGSWAQASFNENGDLSGSFWLKSSGWATFKPEGKAKISCPNDILQKTVKNETEVCNLTGYAWVHAAGWVALQNVKYNPNSGNLEGFGWSRSLGWIPMFTGKKFLSAQKGTGFVVNLDTTWYATDADKNKTLNLNFIGKVVIIGNIAGTKVAETVKNKYNFINQNLGAKFTDIQHAPLLNQVRANVAQLVRNINKNNYITNPLNGFIYNEDKDYCIRTDHSSWHTEYCSSAGPWEQRVLLNQTDVDFSKIKTIIVKWHDIIIDGNFNATTDNLSNHPTAENMKTIIALRWTDGSGGNIYITKNTDQIFGYLVAEGSVFSGEKTSTGAKELYINKWFATAALPQNQLYVNGTIVSKNTIGGNIQDDSTAMCPVFIECNASIAKQYDFSYFRNYIYKEGNQGNSLPQYRQNVIDTIKDATLIIDYNWNIISAPPPGLENFR